LTRERVDVVKPVILAVDDDPEVLGAVERISSSTTGATTGS